MEKGKLSPLLAGLLRKVAQDIDAGNSNINEEEALMICEHIHAMSDKTEILSTYEACRYPNVSRATFNNYIKAGYIDKGKHLLGFQALGYKKKDLDAFIAKRKADRKRAQRNEKIG